MFLVAQTIALLQNVFANEMTRSADAHLHFPSFNVSIPDCNPTHDHNYDSGVFVIRHMQQHSKNWFTHFHMHDLRKCIAIDIVNNPRNSVIHSELTSHVEDNRANVDDVTELNYRQVPDWETHESSDNEVYDFVPKWSNRPTGRKCRSHWLRRSRA